MKFLTDNTTLVQFTPNVISPVEGEENLFTKIQRFIQLTEAWFESRIATYEQLSALENSEELLTFARTAIASDAYGLLWFGCKYIAFICRVQSNMWHRSYCPYR